MRRREFMTLVGGAAATWPLSSRVEANPGRFVAALWPFQEDEPEAKASLAALQQGLRELGWVDIRIESRWGGGNLERTRAYAAELVQLSPDVIFAYFNAQLAPLSRETSKIPIVFVGASDPVGAGYVASLPHPGGNITGFTLYEASLAGKWLGILREMAPRLTRVCLLINPETAVLRGSLYSTAFEVAGASLGIEPVIAKVYSPADIATTIESLGKPPVGGLIVAPDTFSEINGASIVSLAAQHLVPTVYAISLFARAGGLVSYGPNTPDAIRRAASYIDRILRGEKAADLPVQAPVKFDLIVNLKAAKALGLAIPESFLLRADEVIE